MRVDSPVFIWGPHANLEWRQCVPRYSFNFQSILDLVVVTPLGTYYDTIDYVVSIRSGLA
jgi:hypothetical protein